MVQVDFFWSYAIGAQFAFCAARQLVKEHEDKAAGGEKDRLLDNKYFTRCLLFLATIFVPTGVYLLWRFTSWETMHVARSFSSIPAWLVTLFVFNNVTQGILGFWITRKLLTMGKPFAAFLQMLLANFIFWFILGYGWDGTGYQRFFASTRHAWLNWSSAEVANWFGSEVMWTLFVMGCVFAPVFFIWSYKFIREGYAMAPALNRPDWDSPFGRFRTACLVAGIWPVLTLASAFVAGLFVRWIGWVGLVPFAVLAAVGCTRWGIYRFYFDELFNPGPARILPRARSTS